MRQTNDGNTYERSCAFAQRRQYCTRRRQRSSFTFVSAAQTLLQLGRMVSGISVGHDRGHVTTPRVIKKGAASRKGRLGKRVKMIRELVREVAGPAPYEKRMMELLKVGKDKRALKLAKKKLGTHIRAKKKREDMGGLLRKMRAAGTDEKKAKKK